MNTKSNFKLKEKKFNLKFLSFFLFLFLSISLINATSVGTEVSDFTEGKVIYTPTATSSVNYSLQNVNNSNFWDGLDTPADIFANGMWTRTATTLSPTNAGDDIETTGNVTASWGIFDDLNVSNSSIYIGSVKLSSSGNVLNVENSNVTANFFTGDGSKLSNINSTGVHIQKYSSSDNANGSLYTTGANSTSSKSNSLFQVISDTRGTPQFMVQDGGPNQASLMVRSWIVVNQNDTKLNQSQNNICSDWGFTFLDCNTSTTGADFGVTDDMEVFGLIHTKTGLRAQTTPGGAYLASGEYGVKYVGFNGYYNVDNDFFCDDADPFLDVGGWLQIVDEIVDGGVRQGMLADVDVFINSTCVSLKNNPGWNESFAGVDFAVVNSPELIYLDGGFFEYYVGDNSKSQFKVKTKNGTGFTGVYIDDTAGVDQHQGLTLTQMINNFGGIVGLNIFSSSSSSKPTVNKDYHLQTLELDTTNINTSSLTFIGALQFGGNIENEIDFLHVSGEFTNIVKAGDNDILQRAYYDAANGTTKDVTTYFTSTDINTPLFENDNSIIYIGSDVNFTTIGFSLFSPGSTAIDAEFYYCNLSGIWKPLLGATSTINGFKTGGTVHFDSPDDRGACNAEIDTTAFADATNYNYIAVKRTRNFIVTDAVESLVTISGGGAVMLLRDDYMRLNPVNTAPETCTAVNLGAIYYDISEDNMCVCKAAGWKVMEDGTDCT